MKKYVNYWQFNKSAKWVNYIKTFFEVEGQEKINSLGDDKENLELEPDNHKQRRDSLCQYTFQSVISFTNYCSTRIY